MFNTTILFTALLITWIIFSGYLDAFFIISGAISCLIAIFFTRRMKLLNYEHFPLYMRLRFIRYSLWLLREMILSGIDVSKRCWQVNPQISPVMATLPAHEKTDVGKALFANSITLTPGTVCTDVAEQTVTIHALSNDALQDLKRGEMDQHVTKVEA